MDGILNIMGEWSFACLSFSLVLLLRIWNILNSTLLLPSSSSHSHVYFVSINNLPHSIWFSSLSCLLLLISPPHSILERFAWWKERSSRSWKNARVAAGSHSDNWMLPQQRWAVCWAQLHDWYEWVRESDPMLGSFVYAEKFCSKYVFQLSITF